MMEDRKLRILKAIVEDYVLTAVPVGSRTVARKYLSHLSSATIRNEMSDLTELGYLSQPHVSAGRVPSARAYRLYVDKLLEEAGNGEEEEAGRDFVRKVSHLEDLARSTAQALAEMTGLASFVMMPAQSDLRIATLQLVPVSTALALLVIVTDGGIIRDTMVQVAGYLDADALYAISRMLSERFTGRTLKEVQSLLEEFAMHLPSDPHVLQGISDLASQMDRQNAQDSLMVCGAHNILAFPEYQDAEKARQFLGVMDDKKRLLTLIRRAEGEDISVCIGPESGIPEMESCSIALAQYSLSRGQRGAIGLVGPTRMPYARVLSTLRQVSRRMSDMLNTI